MRDTVASRATGSVRSPPTVSARAPVASSSSTAAAASASSRPYASTKSFVPVAARRFAVARPMPPEPPVITAAPSAAAGEAQVVMASIGRTK